MTADLSGSLRTQEAGQRWSDLFPVRRAVVLQDGHVDHITGPRCIVQMREGPSNGLYLIAHTDVVLSEGTEVLVNDRTGRLRATTAASDSAVGPDGPHSGPGVDPK